MRFYILSDFHIEELYPERLAFADPNDGIKEEYPPIEGYIKRSVSSYELASQGTLARLLSKEKSGTLFDALITHKKVLLLCDAGMQMD